MTLNIVMLQPQIPQNTGNIARTCAVTGARLHLVGPLGFVADDKKLRRAGLDYWHNLDITLYKNINEFFENVSGGVLKSVDGAPDTSEFNFYYFETSAHKFYTEPRYENNTYIFFGGEVVGIDEALLEKNPNQCVRFPMHENARSLNLSNAVAIGVFEVWRQWGFPKLEHFGSIESFGQDADKINKI